MIKQAWAAVMVAVLISSCGSSTAKVTADQLRAHAESTLTYPHSYRASAYQQDENDSDSWFQIEHTDPTPALAEIHFYTVDTVDKVLSWYDKWLSAHGWQDVQPQGDGSRKWDRGSNEEFLVSCGHQRDSSDLWCDVQYNILSPRFHLSYSAAPPLGDPVSLAAVEQRRVGLAAASASVNDPRDGTSEASAARENWPHESCCGKPVLLLDAAAAEQASPSRSAYHVITLQVAEYDVPSVPNETFGQIESTESYDLVYAGFVLVKTGKTLMRGQAATAYEYMRGGREAVLYAIAYGPPVQGSGYAYRVVTLSIIYDVAPKSCPLNRSECFSLLYAGGPAIGWSF